MKRLLLIVALAACDDPEVTGKVASVLEHGIVDAQFQCTGGTATLTVSPFDTIGIGDYRVQRLVDGSCFVSGGPFGGTPRLIARSESEAATCLVGIGSTFQKVEDGVLTFTQNANTYEADLETECAGFNLEAFGVE